MYQDYYHLSDFLLLLRADPPTDLTTLLGLCRNSRDAFLATCLLVLITLFFTISFFVALNYIGSTKPNWYDFTSLHYPQSTCKQ